MKNIHTNLKELRIERGFTQKEAAERIGLTRQAISGYESGKRQPGIDILMKLAEIYEVSIETILYGPREHTEKQKLKRIAIAAAVIFFTFQILTGIFSTLSFVLYPIKEGPMMQDQIEILEKHLELGQWADRADQAAAASLFLCSLVVTGFDLSLRDTFSWKRKLAFFFTAFGISLIIAFILGMIHPVFRAVDFITRGPIYFTFAAVFLAADLLISFLKQRR